MTRLPRQGIEIGEAVRPDSEVVVIRSRRSRKASPSGSGSRKLHGSGAIRAHRRATDVETQPGQAAERHRLAGRLVSYDELGALVSESEDGRVRLSFVNPRPDSVDVFIKARKR